MLPLRRIGETIELVDQRQLPDRLVRSCIDDYERLVEAIVTLEVRGAPAIGFAGAYAVCLAAKAALALPPEDRDSFFNRALTTVRTARPTAVNLERAVAILAGLVTRPLDVALLEELWQAADALLAEDQANCRRLREHGVALLEDGGSYLTHCNAGGLATSGLGTALGLFLEAQAAGMHIRVWVDETRPLLQGARITTWELREAGIDATLVTDSMAAHLMQQQRVDAVIVGADRIAANGDAANKIGTLGLAVLASHYGVPFYVVAPESTLDRSLATGAGIPVEERDADEVRRLGDRWTAPRDQAVYNPAFDVTPAALVTGIVTERGIYRPPYALANNKS